MHELAICQALISQVTALARRENADRVVSIRVQVGPLSGVEPRLLERAFPLARAGTIAASADLQVETMTVRVECSRCGAAGEATPNRLLCGACGAWQTRIVSGDELLLRNVELIAEGPIH